MNRLQIPPIRQSLKEVAPDTPPSNGGNANGDGSQSAPQPDQTSKNWYLYWSQTGDQTNANTTKLDGLVTYGTHEDRPPADTMPDGALYVDENRGGVIYQSQTFNGVQDWHYLAGTMWGTQVPDQRPTDLGVNDTGFTFRTTDQPAREFIWSGTAWVQVNWVMYGTHAARLALAPASIIDGILYVETDRGNALYQIQAGTWMLITGVMWGTLTPDQRPTDLGVDDAGFEFWATDAPTRYIWNSSAWTDITPPSPGSPVNSVQFNNAGTFGGSVSLMWDNANSRLGIQSATPIAPLNVIGPSSAAGPALGQVIVASSAGGNAEQIVIGVHDGDYSYLQAVKPGTALRNLLLNPDGGLVGIGMTNPTYLLQLPTDSAAKPTTNTWSVPSDMRLKRNVQPFEGGINVIRALDPIIGEYNGKGGTPEGGRVVSLDAARLREILPHAVSSSRAKLDPEDAEETDILGVNTHEIFYHMLRAIQQLDRELEEVKQKLK